jgi:SAM-dependent methyltransferase
VLLTVDLDRLELRPGDTLLDAGCGEGRHCFGALERGVRVVGLDLDRAALGRAAGALRFRARELGGFGVMLQGNTFHLPFRDATFDKLICSEVMEHVHDYRAAARELARVTRPRGRVAVTIPTATSENLYLRLGDDYFESPGGHIRIFRPRDLAQALADAGLAPVGVGFAHALHTPYWALRSVAGLPHADDSRLVRAYRRFLIRASVSPGLARLERVLNYCFPKSLILYAEKRPASAARSEPKASGVHSDRAARSEPKASGVHSGPASVG